jgi:hypothetical protein
MDTTVLFAAFPPLILRNKMVAPQFPMEEHSSGMASGAVF